MSSALLRQDLVPIVTGYLLIMGSLAVGLLLLRRSPGPGGAGSGARPARREAASIWRQPGWPRLIRHLAGTVAGGYVLLMVVVFGYYYGIAKVGSDFLISAVTGCAMLAGITAPAFLAASWLTERRRRPGQRPDGGQRRRARRR